MGNSVGGLGWRMEIEKVSAENGGGEGGVHFIPNDMLNPARFACWTPKAGLRLGRRLA